MTTTHSFKYTDMELRQIGIAVLLQNLGYAETLRFISQISPGQGDYLLWREKLFAKATINEIFDQARDHFTKTRNQAG